MVQFEKLLEQHNIEISDLPEKTQRKIESFDEVYEEYQNAEENSKEEEDLELRLESLDEGITNDLQSFIESKSKEDGGQTNDKPNTPPVKDTPPASNQENNSNWMFWM